MGSKNQPVNLDKDLLYDLYVNKQMSPREIADYLGNVHKNTVGNYLVKYGIPLRTMSQSVAIADAKRAPEALAKRADKMRAAWNSKSPEEQERLKNALLSNANTPEAVKKIIATRRKNGTFNTSKVEENIYNSLINKYFNVKRNYNEDPRYPFQCDFYIPDQDLFIEINHHPTHYKEPFNENNPEHLEYLEKCKENPKNWIEKDLPRVWAGYDKRKIDTAIKNNLNYIVVYPKQSYKVENGKLVALQSNEL